MEWNEGAYFRIISLKESTKYIRVQYDNLSVNDRLIV